MSTIATAIAGDKALAIAQADAVHAYRDLAPFRIQLALEDGVLERLEVHHRSVGTAHAHVATVEICDHLLHPGHASGHGANHVVLISVIDAHVRIGGPDKHRVDSSISLFQIVEGLRYAFPKAMTRLEKKIPHIIALHDSVAVRPRIAAYLASERRIGFNEQGIFRHYKELDA